MICSRDRLNNKKLIVYQKKQYQSVKSKQNQYNLKDDTKYIYIYGLEYGLVMLIVELEFDLEIHYIVIVNGILHNYHYHSKQKEFIMK